MVVNRALKESRRWRYHWSSHRFPHVFEFDHPSGKPPAINHATLVKRFSQLSGVPIRDFSPTVEQTAKRGGVYKIFLHHIQYNPRYPYTRRHEERHALQFLSQGTRLAYNQLNDAADREIAKITEMTTLPAAVKRLPKILYRINRLTNMHHQWIEPTNADPDRNLLSESFKNLGERQASKIAMVAGVLSPVPLLAGLWAATHYGLALTRQVFVRRIIARHGEDGLLLLWAAPPKKLDALQVPKWEKEMVEKGFLLPSGGMTKAGIRYWRQHVQPQAIWDFLKKAEEKRVKNREKKSQKK